MRYILDSMQMKQVDEISIKKIGIPSMVLMERAALCVAEFIENMFTKKTRILCVCGGGNNGADGIAAGRILFEKGYDVTVWLEGKGTQECENQISIAKKSGVKLKNYTRSNNTVIPEEFDIIIDAVFGIGLSRDVEGSFAQIIKAINDSKAVVVSVDIPSGINATTGQIMGDAVKADHTVTFGYKKTGIMIFPGAEHSGTVKVADIGFPKAAEIKIPKKAFTFTQKDLKCIPKRKKNTNKGQYGKVLVIAGSETMGGAACLAGLSAYRSGAGLVKVLTHTDNRNAVLKAVPEALITTYDSTFDRDKIEKMISAEFEWASCIIIGPGLSKSETAIAMTENVIRNAYVPVIIDADALNIVADLIKDPERTAGVFRDNNAAALIFTPHIGEMERLSGTDKDIIKADPVRHAEHFVKDFMKKYAVCNEVICVMKDARTIVTGLSGGTYINGSGNSGMAKGGSGDVLTGVIAGLIVNGMSCFDASCMGVYIHGLAGDLGASDKGEYGMKAGDIIDNICEVMKHGQGR